MSKITKVKKAKGSEPPKKRRKVDQPLDNNQKGSQIVDSDDEQEEDYDKSYDDYNYDNQYRSDDHYQDDKSDDDGNGDDAESHVSRESNVTDLKDEEKQEETMNLSLAEQLDRIQKYFPKEVVASEPPKQKTLKELFITAVS